MKTKLNQQRQTTIIEALKKGNYKETAAAAAGIGESTFYNWLQRGDREKEQGETTIYTEFLEAIKKAEAEAEMHNIALIRDAAPTNWQAAAWLEERKHPQRWGKRVQHTADITTQSRVDLRKLSDEDLNQIEELLSKAETT